MMFLKKNVFALLALFAARTCSLNEVQRNPVYTLLHIIPVLIGCNLGHNSNLVHHQTNSRRIR